MIHQSLVVYFCSLKDVFKPASAAFVTNEKVLCTMVKSDILVLKVRGSPGLPEIHNILVSRLTKQFYVTATCIDADRIGAIRSSLPILATL